MRSLLFLILPLFLSADIKLEKITTYDQNGQKLEEINPRVIKDIKSILNIWKESHSSLGNANVTLIVDGAKGKVESFIINNSKGNKVFKKDLKNFLNESLKTPLPSIINGNLRLADVEIEANNFNANPESAVYNQNAIYSKYTDLLKKRGYTAKEIKQKLNSPQLSSMKAMLYGMYYKYKKRDAKKGDLYFKKILNADNSLKKTQGAEEATILSDLLLKEKKYNTILQLLPSGSCKRMEMPFSIICKYERGISLYKKGDPAYKKLLMYVKPYYKTARMITNTGETE